MLPKRTLYIRGQLSHNPLPNKQIATKKTAPIVIPLNQKKKVVPFVNNKQLQPPEQLRIIHAKKMEIEKLKENVYQVKRMTRRPVDQQRTLPRTPPQQQNKIEQLKKEYCENNATDNPIQNITNCILCYAITELYTDKIAAEIQTEINNLNKNKPTPDDYIAIKQNCNILITFCINSIKHFVNGNIRNGHIPTSNPKKTTQAINIFKTNKPFSDATRNKYIVCDTTDVYNSTNVDDIYNKLNNTTQAQKLNNTKQAQNTTNMSYVTQRKNIRNNPIIVNCAYSAIQNLQILKTKYTPKILGGGDDCKDIIAYSYTWPLNMWQYVQYVYSIGIADTDKTIINTIDDSITNMCIQYISLMIKANLYPILNDRYTNPTTTVNFDEYGDPNLPAKK